jgi:hypothetical protein
MMTASRKISGFAIFTLIAVLVAFTPTALRRAARGELIADYIRQHGSPTAVATQCRVLPFPGRLISIRLDGVRLFTNSDPPVRFAGQLLVYPQSDDAIRHFRYLPTEEPLKGERSVHYSQRRLFFPERLTVVRVDAVGRVADVEDRPYNTFTIYE